MKIAIILRGGSSEKGGAFIATHNRIKHLLLSSDFEIDVFLFQTHENSVVRKLRDSQRRDKTDCYIYDGITYNNLWYEFSLIDYVFRMKIRRLGPFFLFTLKKWTVLFQHYDLISAHSFDAGLLAYNINKKYKIPFVITWHGSDIHSEPFSNPSVYSWTKTLLQSAICNLFVSNYLADISKKICGEITKEVLYNGVDTNLFRQYSESELRAFREKFNISTESKNVAFIGDLLPIKNSDILPEIFIDIRTRIVETSFYVIGGGKLRKKIEYECKRLNLEVKFLGTQDPSYIPGFINCMDLLLLPSKNEGLPLIALESLACGVPIIGSRVGGIVESIGIENTIELDEMFIENFSKKAIDILTNKRDVKLSSKFDWIKTAKNESKLYYKYLKTDK
jgi:glycosyltransferase involved in cell wall biosynthesis